MEWFYARGGQQAGPVDEAILRGMLASGQLTASDLVWKEPMANWLPAGSVAELFASAVPTGAAGASQAALPATGYPQPGPLQEQEFLPYFGAPNPISYRQTAIGSLTCSCIGLAFLGIVLGPIGLVMGIVALRGMKRSGNPDGRGMAIAGVVIGAIITLVTTVAITVVILSLTHKRLF